MGTSLLLLTVVLLGNSSVNVKCVITFLSSTLCSNKVILKNISRGKKTKSYVTDGELISSNSEMIKCNVKFIENFFVIWFHSYMY